MSKNNINIFYTYLQSQQAAQQYLLDCYKDMEGINADIKSYENCETFFYFLKHGHTFYEQGKIAPTETKPILYFYGMTHLLKAALLTKRPNYPETTQILAHGVSSRKLKKRDYRFMDDAVKIQNHGLFSYVFEHLFSQSTKSFEKINMRHLLGMIPDMHELFLLHNQQTLVPVGKINNQHLVFPTYLLDQYHLTEQRFLQRIIPYMPKIVHSSMNYDEINIQLAEPLDHSNLLFSFNFNDQFIYFPAERHLFVPLPEVMTHYLLLYNLSMLSRYETQWWGNLLHARDTIDYPFIKHFLDVTSEKIPFLIGNILYNEHLI